MNDNDLQKTWQSQEPERRITIDLDVLLREVRWNHRQFRAVIFWRDVREAGGALLLAPAMIFWVDNDLSEVKWPPYLIAASLVVVAAFILLDRFRQRRRQPAPGDSLLGWAESSLADVEHQVWLLRNVFWWYILPPGAAIAAVYARATWECRNLWRPPINVWGVLVMLLVWTGTAALFYGVYRLNQYWVIKEGEPRRQELTNLVDSLKSLEMKEA